MEVVLVAEYSVLVLLVVALLVEVAEVLVGHSVAVVHFVVAVAAHFVVAIVAAAAVLLLTVPGLAVVAFSVKLP